jgi:hypothetical protein
MPKKVMMLLAFLSLAACGGTSQTASNETPSASGSAPAKLSPSAATERVIDPCQLVTQQEASQLAGTTFGVGKEETTSGGGRTCVYGAQTVNVFTIALVIAPDAATAQAGWNEAQTQAQSQLQQEGVNITLDQTTLPGADKTVTGRANETLNGQAISISAIYVLKGNTFFTFSDLVLGTGAPSIAQMEAQAQTSLSRV